MITRIPEERRQKLLSDRIKEAEYGSQRCAIQKALAKKNRKMFKIPNSPIFRVDNATRTKIYYNVVTGIWFSEDKHYQSLINKAIASTKA